MWLSDISSDKKCKIKNVHATGILFYKLLDMGFINGAEIYVVREAPLYDPMQLKIQDYLVTIRKSEAELIEVEV